MSSSSQMLAPASSSRIRLSSRVQGVKSRSVSLVHLDLLVVLLMLANAWRLAVSPVLGRGDVQGYEISYMASGLCDCVVASTRYPLEVVWPHAVLAANHLGISFVLFHGLVILTSSLLWAVVARTIRASLGLSAVPAVAFTLAVSLWLITWPFLIAGYSNVLRSSLAVPLVVCALINLQQRRWLAGVCLALVAVGIQQPISILLFLGGALGLALGRRRATIAFCFAVLVYASNLVNAALPLLGLEDVASSIEQNQLDFREVYLSGIRWDFLASVILLVGAMHLASRLVGESEVFQRLVAIAIGLTFPFLVMGTIAFSDRLLHGVWNLAPLLLLASVAATARLAVWLGLVSSVALGVTSLLWVGGSQ